MGVKPEIISKTGLAGWVFSCLVLTSTLIAPTTSYANRTCVGSVNVTVSPNNPQPGDPVDVKVRVNPGCNGSWCSVGVSVDLPGASSKPGSPTSGTGLQIHKQGQAKNDVSATFISSWIIDNPATTTSLRPVVDVSGCGGSSFTASPPGNPMVSIPAVAAVTLTKTLDTGQASTVTPGATVNFKLTYQNVGTASAASVVITDTLPAGLAFTGSTNNLCTAVSQTVTCNLGSLAPGAARSLRIQTKVDAGAVGSKTNSATLNFDGTTVGPRTATVTVATTPLIELTKTIGATNSVASPPPMLPGTAVLYKVCYENVGNAPASGVTIRDTLPAEFDPGSVTIGGGATNSFDASSRVATWNVGNVAKGQSNCVGLQATLLNTASGIIVNTATGTATTGTVQPSNPATITVTSEPYLDLDKSVQPAIASPGDSLVFTLRYRNLGTITATAPVLKDRIPDDLVLDTASLGQYGSYDSVSRIITWNLPDLQVGTSFHSLAYRTTVSSSAPSGTINNLAVLTAGNTPYSLTGSARTDVTVQAEPVLTLLKERLAPASPVDDVEDGDTIRYALNVSNTGSGDTDGGIVLTDVLPASLDFTQCLPTLKCSYDAATRTVTWNMDDLTHGTALAPATLTVSVVGSVLTEGDAIDNNFSAATQDPLARSYNFSSNTDTVKYLLPPGIAVTKSAVPSNTTLLKPGDLVTYTITAQATNKTPLSDVVIRDVLPSNLDFVKSIPPYSLTTLSSGDRAIITTAQGLTSGQVETLTVIGRVPAGAQPGGKIANVAAVSFDNGGNVHGQDIARLEHVLGDAQVLLTKTRPAAKSELVVGEQITYEISVSNPGPFELTTINVWDTLPAGLTLLSTQPSAPPPTANTIQWPTFSLKAGQKRDFLVTAEVDGSKTSGRLINQVNLTTQQTQPASKTVESTVRLGPKLAISKSVNPPVAHPGDAVTFTITATNNGKGDAENPTLEDILPTGLTFISATDGVTPVSGRLDWDIGRDPGTGTRILSPGKSVTKKVQMTVPSASYSPPTVVSNISAVISDKNYAIDGASLELQDAPAFKITKDVDQTDTKPGATLHYTINIEKSGGAATDVYIVDQLDASSPASLDYSSVVSDTPLATNTGALQLDADLASGFLSWKLPDFAVGNSTAVIHYDVAVNTPLADGTKIANTAYVQLPGLGGGVVQSNTVESTVRSSPVLGLTKGQSTALLYSHPASDPNTKASDAITYTLVATNTGDEIATNVTVTDTLPGELTGISSPTGIVSGQDVTWTIPQLIPGSDVTLLVTAQAKDNLPDNTSVDNQAHISTTMSGVGSANSNQVSAATTGEAVLALSKTANSRSVQAGEQISYTLTYSNIGTATTSDNVIVEDLLPANTSFVSATAPGAETSSGSGVVQWELPPLGAGQSGSLILTLLVDAVVPNGTALDNSASIKVKGGNNTTPATIDKKKTVTVTSAPLLTLDKSNNTQGNVAVVGTDVLYEITYENIGSDKATDLVIIDKLPTALTNVVALPTPDSVSPDGRLLTWNKAELAAKGQPGKIVVQGTVSPSLSDGDTFTNSASVTSKLLTKPVGDTSTITAQDARLTLSKSADVSVAASGVSATSTPGTTVTYTLTYSNKGSATATGIILTDTLPANVTYIANSASPAPSSVSGQQLEWLLPDLGAGRKGFATFKVQVNDDLRDGTILTNSALVASNTTGQVGDSYDISVTSKPDLLLSKRLNGVAQAIPGQTLSWDITVENRGSDTASNVVITDTLPANTTWVDTGSGSHSMGVISWGPFVLGPNTSTTVQAKATVASVLANGTLLDNSVQVTGVDSVASPLPTLTANQVTPVVSSPILQIDIDVDKPIISAGDGALYTIVIRNVGNDIAHDVEVAANLPLGASPQAIDHGGSFTPDGAFASWQIGSLPPAGSITLQFSASIPIGTLNGQTELVVAGIEGSNAGFASDVALSLVASSPGLSLDKTGPNSVEAGELITWTLPYSNFGNTAATNLTLTDTLPPGTTFESASDGGSETAPGSGVVEWNLGSLPALAGGSVTLQVRADAGIANGTVINNTATLAASNAPPAIASASVVERSHTELEVDITATADPIPAGDTETFTVNWGNIGNQDTTNAVITASIPPDSDLEGTPSNGGTRVGRTVQWSVADLDAGDSGSATFTVRTVAPLNNGIRLTSVADISADDGLPKSASDDFMVSSSPIWVKAKTPDATSLVPGDFVNFDIDLINLGNESATQVSVVDNLPPGLQVDSAGQSGVVDTAANTVTWTLGTVAPNAPVTLTVRARVLAADTTLINTATVSSFELPDVIVTGSLNSGDQPPIPVLPRDIYLWLLLTAMGLMAWRYQLRSRRFRGSR